MNIFTPSEKKKIKKDWNESMRFYSKYKLNCMIKRNDPILTGVYLHMGGSAERYTPAFFMHNLMIPDETISLGGYGPMRVQPQNPIEESINYKKHSEKFEDIISEFRNQYPIAFLDYVDYDVVNSYYESFINNPQINEPYPLYEMMGHILLMFWYGEQEEGIKNKIKEYEHIQGFWPEGAHAKARSSWKEDLLRLLDHQELSRTIESEITKFGIEKINIFPMKKLCEAGK